MVNSMAKTAVESARRIAIVCAYERALRPGVHDSIRGIQIDGNETVDLASVRQGRAAKLGLLPRRSGGPETWVWAGGPGQ